MGYVRSLHMCTQMRHKKQHDCTYSWHGYQIHELRHGKEDTFYSGKMPDRNLLKEFN